MGRGWEQVGNRIGTGQERNGNGTGMGLEWDRNRTGLGNTMGIPAQLIWGWCATRKSSFALVQLISNPVVFFHSKVS